MTKLVPVTGIGGTLAASSLRRLPSFLALSEKYLSLLSHIVLSVRYEVVGTLISKIRLFCNFLVKL